MRGLALILTMLAACASTPAGPYTPPGEADRDRTRAEELTRQAADLIATDLERAEALLREALTADLFHGPGHNNLGVVFLKQEKYYEAAQEFEWARKLMPGHPDPRVNLGLVMEAAGRTADALGAYASALELRAEYLPAMQGLARLLVRTDGQDERLTELLAHIALASPDAQWRDWAALELAKRDG